VHSGTLWGWVDFLYPFVLMLVSIDQLRSRSGSKGYIDSFIGKMRDELLDIEIFYSRKESQILIEMWRNQHNVVRDLSSPGYKLPVPATVVIQPSQIQ